MASKKLINGLVSDAKIAWDSEERSNARNEWHLLSKFLNPNMSGNYLGDDDTKGGKKTDDLFISTGISASGDLSSSIHSSLTSPSITWSKFKFRSELSQEAGTWLDEANKTFHREINRSNFSLEIQKGYRSDVVIGSSPLIWQEKDPNAPQFSGLIFESWSMAEVAWEEGRENLVDRFYRQTKMTGPKAVRVFGEDKLSEEIVNASKVGAKNRDTQFTIWFIIVPNDPKKIRVSDTSRPVPPRARPWQLYVVEEKSKNVIQEIGYFEKPANGFRWEVMPQEVYGRGPGHNALPDVKSTNLARKWSLQAAQKTIMPTMLVKNRGVLGSLNMNAGGVTVVKDVENSVKAMQLGINFDVANLTVSEMTQSIKEMFFLDKIMLPPRTEVGEQTAFEVAERLKALNKVIGPVISRYIYERLNQVTTPIFFMMLRRGAFGTPPEDVQGVEFDIEFVNPLAKAQRVEELNAVEGWVAGLLSVEGAGLSGATDAIDIDGYSDITADIRGVPASVIAVQKVRDGIRESRAKAQQQQAQIEQENMQADTDVKRSSIKDGQNNNQG